MESEVFSSLSKSLRTEVQALGWEKATAIQVLALPAILQGNNVLLIAPTGTGKTEAAIFPVFEQFLTERSQLSIQGISILYITPLRALNRDIFIRLIEIGEKLGIKIQVRHGDTTQYERRKQALSPPDMLITTPETFQAILPGKRMSKHLSTVQWVVVDEVHELATDKRGTQLSLGLERLNRLTGREFQRIGLSATIGSPELIAQFLCGAHRAYQVLKTVESKDQDVWVESPTAHTADQKDAQKLLLSPGSVRRIQRLFELIDRYTTSLIFTNTRENAEALSSRMMALRPHVQVGVHHGSLSKAVRVEAEKNLKAGRLKAVVCTSSLELGIDVGNIEFVVQYLSPKQVTRLVQRIGRSGHIIAGQSRGCIIAAWPDDILESAVIASRALKGVLELPKIHTNALDVLAHQIAGLALDYGQISLDDVYSIVTKAWPYKGLQYVELTAVVEELVERKILWLNGTTVRRRYPRIFRYYYENLSTIPDVKRYSVIDFLRRNRIGTLDQEFIAKNGEIGQEFIMQGQTWRLLSVDDEEGLIQVEPVNQSFGAIPSWEGEVIPVPFTVAQEVGHMRQTLVHGNGQEFDQHQGFHDLPLDQEAFTKITDILERQKKQGYPVPTDQRMLVECYENYVIIHGCFGNLVNETLGKAIASLLSSRMGINIGTQVDAYRIALLSPSYLDPHIIVKEIRGITSEDLFSILSGTLQYTSLFAWRLWNVAKRFGIVGRQAEYRSSRGRMLASILKDTPVYNETLREIFLEKMDLENAGKVLDQIQAGVIEIEAAQNQQYSPLALPILDRIAPHDILRPVMPTGTLIEVVKDRLELGRVRLVCILNGDYNGVRGLRTLPDTVRCPKCGSTLLAAIHPRELNLINLVKKKMAKRKLSSVEEKEWQKAWKSASLVQTYGKQALLTLVARGVGPTNAVRILRNYHRTEDDFYMDIIKAERDYARTRMFWDR